MKLVDADQNLYSFSSAHRRSSWCGQNAEQLLSLAHNIILLNIDDTILIEQCSDDKIWTELTAITCNSTISF